MGASCFHCGEPVPAHSPYQSTIKGELVSFCCPACQAISETIIGGGLADYYRQREVMADTPKRYDFTVWDYPKLQASFVSQEGDYSRASLYIEGMHCTACAWLIEKHLSRLTDIRKASVNYQQNALLLEWRTDAIKLSDIMTAVADIGYTPHPYQADTIKERQQAQHKKMLKRIGISAILMMQIGMFSIGLYAGDFLGIEDSYKQLLSTFSLLFSIPLLYYGALPFFSAAYFKLRNLQLSMDVSVSLAITGLYSSSVYSVITGRGDIYFDSIAMLCLFILTARYIEQKSRMELIPPSALLPAIATRVLDKQTETVPLADIQSGDILIIQEGEIVPLDGCVVSGQSSVSEAFINGEAEPLKKQAGDNVYAGSQNHDGQLTICVSHRSEESLVKKIEQLSTRAAEDKPRMISITDAIAGHFTLAILTLSTLTLVYWLWQGNDQAFWIALSVLVVSCPCALSLAAPTALSAIQFRLRQRGILIQASQVIEKLQHIDHVIFDKTGTLTEGQYRILQTRLVDAEDENHCLQIASALEATSRHPIAQAFQHKGLLASQIQIVPNKGIEGVIAHQRFRIGKPGYCQQWHATETPPNHTQQWVGLCSEQDFLAWFALGDALRTDAKPLVDQLQRRHLALEILSGDASGNVAEVAEALNISDFHNNLSSEDKLEQLRHHAELGHHTLMVGDGVNDAPVLSLSDVSVTLLDACDWVKHNADMILLNNQLLSIEEALHSAERYQRVLKQNFTWALLYNGIAIPFAMTGFITPYIAALGMSLSSVIVVLNSRRLA